jgi:cardiolipin synthase
MASARAGSLPRRSRGHWRGRLHLGLVCILCGCQAVPARFATCDNPETTSSRKSIALRQIAGDTARETVRRPLRSAGEVALVEPALLLKGAATGLVSKRILPHLRSRPGPVVPTRPPLAVESLEAELAKVSGDELQPASVNLYTEGAEALEALETALEGAKCRIDVLMYLWDNDPLGWEVARRIAAKASPTLTVRVLVDGGGNLLQGQPKTATAGEANAVVCWLARQPHVQIIRIRNPYFRFDHRKIVLVDGRLVWSGGRNFTHEAFFEAHDLTYTLTGPLTGEMATRYDGYWKEQGGPPGPPPPPPLPADDANTLARLVRTSPFDTRLARVVYTAVDRAQHHVYVENPYFTDDVLFKKLVQARRRGVDVRVVVTLDSGSTAIDAANRVLVNRLLSAGIRVYLYPGRLHVKALGVDGVWAYFGTGNFDPLSLRHNRESGLAVSHGSVVGELEERIFRADMRAEWEVHTPLRVSGYDYLMEVVATLLL